MLLKTFEIIAIVAAIMLYFLTTIYGFVKDKFSFYSFYKNRTTSNKAIIIGQIVTVVVAGAIWFFIVPETKINLLTINTVFFNLSLVISSAILLKGAKGFSKRHEKLHVVNTILIIIFACIVLMYQDYLIFAA